MTNAINLAERDYSRFAKELDELLEKHDKSINYPDFPKGGRIAMSEEAAADYTKLMKKWGLI